MGLSASQGRLLLLTAKKSDLEFRAQQIAMLRSILCQQQEAASKEYEDATSNRIMDITLIAATGADVGSARSTDNLTYQNLISGTVSSDIPEEISGIVRSDKAYTNYYEYTSAQMYRLTTPDGAIVVSHESEIPTRDTDTETRTTDSQHVEYKNFVSTSSSSAAYKIKNNDEITYGIVPKSNSALADLINTGETSRTGGFKVDLENGCLEFTNEGTTSYYNLATGELLDAKPEGATFDDNTPSATLYKSSVDVPKSQETVNVYKRELGPAGPDGVQTLYEIKEDGSKVPLQRYLIDPNLTKGFIDAEGGFNDINYLQDCLRNGRYMLQRCIVDKEDPYTPYRWTDISWDAAANITDSYFTDDDAAAKAI